MRTVSFTKFNGQEASLRAQGIRIYGPGASAAQDFEPEYIAVSEDSRTAYVTLQENNAIAEIDIKQREGDSAAAARLQGLQRAAARPRRPMNGTTGPVIGATAAGQKMRLGGFSGLAFEGTTGDGKLKFITHTDRGPNGEPTGINRPFLLPDFKPRLVRFTLDPANGEFELTQQIPLRAANGRPLTGSAEHRAVGRRQPAVQRRSAVDLFGNVLAARSARRRLRRHRGRGRRLVLDGR